MLPFGFGGGILWLWLVLVPLSGWLILHSGFYLQRMWRISDYNRYFRIVLAGVFCTFAGIVLAAFVNTLHLPAALVDVWRFPLDMLNATYGIELNINSGHNVSAIFWSAPLGFATALFLYWISLPKRMRNYWKWRTEFLAEKNGVVRLLEKLDAETIFAVMLTLSNQKIYVGWVRGISDWDNPEPPNQYLYFFPLRSGFRRAESKEIVFTTDYSEIYTDRIDTAKFANLEMLIPVHEIIYAQPFDPAVYAAMQAAKRERASKRKTRARRK